MRLLPLFALALVLVPPAQGAINPAEFTRDAPDQLRVRETARIVQEIEAGGSRLRRVTLVGEVVAQKNASTPRLGQSVVIDYTVDLSARERAGEAHRRAHGDMPGPQFMHEPDPPVPDADGTYWANVAPAGSRWAKGNRHAGAVVDIDGQRHSGAVYVPVSGQYSFDEPD